MSPNALYNYGCCPGSKFRRSASLRVTVDGAAAMAVTAAIGRLLGVPVG